MSFYSFERGQILVVCERDWRRQGDIDCYIDPYLFLLTIPLCVIFKTPLSISSASRQGFSTRGWCGSLPQLALSVTASWHRLKTHSDSSWFWLSRRYLHKSFHNAYDFWSTTWLLLLIYTCASFSEKISDWRLGQGSICNTTTGFNSEFYMTGYHSKVKEPNLSNCLPIVWERIVRFMLFPKSISAMWNANNLVQDLNTSPLPTTITTSSQTFSSQRSKKKYKTILLDECRQYVILSFPTHVETTYLHLQNRGKRSR